jgi:hypothetical protein
MVDEGQRKIMQTLDGTDEDRLDSSTEANASVSQKQINKQ